MFRTEGRVRRVDPQSGSLGLQFESLDTVAPATLSRHFRERLFRGHALSTTGERRMRRPNPPAAATATTRDPARPTPPLNSVDQMHPVTGNGVSVTVATGSRPTIKKN